MRSLVASPSIKHSCSTTAVPLQSVKVINQVSDAVNSSHILRTVSTVRGSQACHFYYNNKQAPAELVSAKGSTARGKSPSDICSACGTDANQLTAAYAQLHDETEKLRTQNRVLKQKNALLNTNLKNLLQQFNFVTSQHLTAQNSALKLKQVNAELHQRIAFFEQKLEQYITVAFEHEERAQDLEEQVKKMRLAHESELAVVRGSKTQKHNKTAVSIDAGAFCAPNTLTASIVSYKCSNRTVEAFALAEQAENHKQTLKELLATIDCLFKDKRSEEAWAEMRTLAEKHREELACARIANVGI